LIVIENFYTKKMITLMMCLTTHYSALQSIAGITSERFSALVTGELQVEVRLVSL